MNSNTKSLRTKMPFMQFFTGDHLKDPALSVCGAATRGIWTDWLCAMHERDRSGELRGTIDQLARLGRCSPTEAEAALIELRDTGAAEVTVTPCHENKTTICVVSNRRMRREFSERKSNAERQKRHRAKYGHADSNGEVAPESRALFHIQSSDTSFSPLSAALNGDGTEWREVEEELFSVGMVEAREAVREARANGASPADVRTVVAHWQAWPGAWGIGALRKRIGLTRPGLDAGQNWPAAKETRAAGPDPVEAQTIKRRREKSERLAAIAAEREGAT